MKRTTIFNIMFVILVLFLVACTAQMKDYKQSCESLSGKWLPGSNECESISQEQCTVLGGTWNECASACRNNPTAQACTMQCIQVCNLN